jgi:hypothetical protein
MLPGFVAEVGAWVVILHPSALVATRQERQVAERSAGYTWGLMGGGLPACPVSGLDTKPPRPSASFAQDAQSSMSYPSSRSRSAFTRRRRSHT